jgi:purine-nucleoside phosphorylase
LQKVLPIKPTLAVVLGSGLQGILDGCEILRRVPFTRLPGFPRPTVPGHGGHLLLARMAGVPFLALCGRAHFYEGYSLQEVTFPIRVLADCGVQALLLTNAAGGINAKFRPGDFMRLTDHINFMGANPLRGAARNGVIPFIDLTQVYDARMGKLLIEAAKQSKVRLHAGTYLAVSGPSYETPAEIRAFAKLGADAVGMSTVPEAIVGRQCGLTVAGLSCITNLAAGRSKGPLSHAEVLDTARQVHSQASELFGAFLKRYASTSTVEVP